MTETKDLEKDSKKIQEEMESILKKYGQASDVPLTNAYWGLQNAYRFAVEEERLVAQQLERAKTSRVEEKKLEVPHK